MTISKTKQLENVDLAFHLILLALGGRAILESFFDQRSDSFKEILATTWKELCDQRWLEERDLYGYPHYRLTGPGWMEALWRTGAGEKTELREWSGTLARALKEHVKGRHQDTTVEVSKLAEESGLSPAWIFNAIESNLLETLHRKRGAQWEDRGTLIRVPLNFGMDLIDHSADLRAQLEEIQSELEHAKEQLGEYSCSFCKAPITFQGSVPLSDQVDGYAVEYACGRCETDGPGSRPCPSDPKFPTLEEYELKFEEHPAESTWKWYCFANGRTPMARQVSLGRGLGQTREEAQQRIAENYKRVSKPWR